VDAYAIPAIATMIITATSENFANMPDIVIASQPLIKKGF